MNILTNRAKAYSYLRFSRPEQMTGDSLRRQTQAARDYAERNGLDLDTDLTFRDLGVSAAAGANAAVGALGHFIQAAESGKVRAGSYLLVEKMDRLSRDKVRAARDRFEALLDKGINIVTLNPERVYSAASYDLTDMIITLIDMSQSRAFSENLSHRVGEAWANKRERAVKEGHKLTARCPAWLRLENGSFEIIEERAAIVRRIFALTLQGWGQASIARQLNIEKVAPFGRADGWHNSYIAKILSNPAVIGQFQPMKRANKFERARKPDGEPIEEYFPAIISEADFYKVKRTRPGPSGKRDDLLPRNVLSGIVFCGRCGGHMHYVNKGNPPKGGTYLACDNARRKRECEAKSVRYQPVLNYVLDNLSEYRNFHEVAAKNRPDLDVEIDSVAAEIAKAEDTVSRLLDTLERVQSESAERRLAEHEARLAALKAQRKELEEKRVIRQDGSDSWNSYVEWYNTPIEPEQIGEVAYAAIAHLSAEIKRVVEKVIVEKGEPIRVVPKSAS